MTEAILTAVGLLLGVAATLIGLLHDEASSRTKMTLSVLALLGLGVGLYGTRVQYQSRMESDAAAREAKKQLSEIQTKVRDVAALDIQIQARTEDLTMLNKLGSGEYYVVIDTFKKDSAPDTRDFTNVKNRLLTLYPNAEASGLLWTAPAPNSPSHYELRFGRCLTPSAAEIFLRLASQGLANGHAYIRRE